MPQCRVRISKPFFLGVFEVTQAQHQAVMGNNPSRFTASGSGKDKITWESTDRYPVEEVSWLDAVQFCNKLSEKEGRSPFYEINGKQVRVRDWNGLGYRLPTEAEWEYACRANSSSPTRFSFGDNTEELGFYGSFRDNSDQRTHAVGKKRPNAFGLYDMHGNVYEWCWDWWGEAYSDQSPAVDPTGPPGASDRVVRGGSWKIKADRARSAARSKRIANYRGTAVGFRLAVSQFGR
jgi:formylglycine-generating enzyme required for sulfatase activity